MPSGLLIQGDARHIPLADESVQCVVTSPPYWYLRDYGVAGQIGLEASPTEYVATIVEAFREVWRVLRSNGTCWVNLGDTYASGGRGGGGSYMAERGDGSWQRRSWVNGWRSAPSGLKDKDLVGIPWRVAFALQDDGWYLRSDIIWSKPNPMPESVTDRPTKSHEYLFLFAKSPRYYYDAPAIREPTTGNAHARGGGVNPKARATGRNSRESVDRDPEHAGRAMKVPTGWNTGKGSHDTLRGTGRYKQNPSFSAAVADLVTMRNRRTVWEIASEPFAEAHFATFPTALVAPCILAGCPAGGIVFDPFSGAGTTGLVASRLGRHYVGLELSREYCLMAQERIRGDAPLLFAAEPPTEAAALSLFGAKG